MKFLGQISTTDWLDCTISYNPRSVWAPRQVADDFDPKTRIGQLIASQQIDASPADVVGVLKGDKRIGDRRRGLALKMDEADRGALITWMADSIANHFTTKNIDLVIPIDSSSTIAHRLAKEIAPKMRAVFSNELSSRKLINKSMNPRTWKFDSHKYDTERTRTSPEQRASFRIELEKQDRRFANMLSNGEMPKSTDFIPSSRRYYDVQELDPALKPDWVQSILVVDDNVREGFTFRALRQRLISRGFDPDRIFFAAGYRLPR